MIAYVQPSSKNSELCYKKVVGTWEEREKGSESSQYVLLK